MTMMCLIGVDVAGSFATPGSAAPLPAIVEATAAAKSLSRTEG